jgi:hypothetical protein
MARRSFLIPARTLVRLTVRMLPEEHKEDWKKHLGMVGIVSDEHVSAGRVVNFPEPVGPMLVGMVKILANIVSREEYESFLTPTDASVTSEEIIEDVPAVEQQEGMFLLV